MSSNNDIINNGVIDYGICCDECGYEIEAGVTGYWRDGVTGVWNDVRYCVICVWDFVKQPNRVTARDIWLRREEARNEQERERRYQREYEEEMEERERERVQEEEERKRNRKKNAALWNILAKQEVARLQKKEQEKERECMEEEDYDWGSPFLEDSFLEELREEEERIESTRLTCEYSDPEEPDPRYDYDSLQSEEIDRSYDWIQAHANKFWSPPPTSVSCDGELSRSYDWDPKHDWTERRASCEILDREILDDEDLIHEDIPHENDIPPIYQDFVKTIPEASKKTDFRNDVPPIYQDFVKTIPLDVINAVQPKNLEVLSDYAELCEIDLFQAYHYKSRCHLYNCNKPVNPDYWDAEQSVQFCCRRHGEYFEDCGHIEEDIDCDVCYLRPRQIYLSHTKNLVSYRALKQSNQGFGPIVSAIRVFDELCMSNILFDSLVDLCEFY